MDASGSELQVVGEFGMYLFRETNNLLSLAARAGAALDLDLAVHGGLRPLPPFAAAPARPPYRLAGSEVDLLSLVVEPGTAVDVVEVLEGERRSGPLPAARRGRDLVCPGDGGAPLSEFFPFAPAACGLADSL